MKSIGNVKPNKEELATSIALVMGMKMDGEDDIGRDIYHNHCTLQRISVKYNTDRRSYVVKQTTHIVKPREDGKYDVLFATVDSSTHKCASGKTASSMLAKCIARGAAAAKLTPVIADILLLVEKIVSSGERKGYDALQALMRKNVVERGLNIDITECSLEELVLWRHDVMTLAKVLNA